MLDIIIVSWNNKAYLERTIKSIIKNSSLSPTIYVHLNEGKDGSEEFLKDNGVKYTKSETNVGLCTGAWEASKLGDNEWVCLADDDMYMFPDWDKELVSFYNENFINDIVWLSSTQLERRGSNTAISNIPWVSEEAMLQSYTNFINAKPATIVTQATPVMTQRWAWEHIKGYPKEFNPGIGSDDAICKELWDLGCRNYVSVPSSIVYHFQGLTTSKINHAEGAHNRDTVFRNKYNTTPLEFMNMIGRGKLWQKK